MLPPKFSVRCSVAILGRYSGYPSHKIMNKEKKIYIYIYLFFYFSYIFVLGGPNFNLPNWNGKPILKTSRRVTPQSVHGFFPSISLFYYSDQVSRTMSFTVRDEYLTVVLTNYINVNFVPLCIETQTGRDLLVILVQIIIVSASQQYVKTILISVKPKSMEYFPWALFPNFSELTLGSL